MAEALLELHLPAELLQLVQTAQRVAAAHLLGDQLRGEHYLGLREAQIGEVGTGSPQLLAVQEQLVGEVHGGGLPAELLQGPLLLFLQGIVALHLVELLLRFARLAAAARLVMVTHDAAGWTSRRQLLAGEGGEVLLRRSWIR